MQLILDTDLLSILQQRTQPASQRLEDRLKTRPVESVCTTIVSFQEQVRGWMAFLNRARVPEKIIAAFDKLEGVLRHFCKLIVLPFNRGAQDRFSELQKMRLRIGTMDLRIAAIALSIGATLLSRNLRDFQQVPGLTVEDWTT